MSKSLNDHHNDGEKDASENEYEPPHGIVDAIFNSVRDAVADTHQRDRDIEENTAYNQGWRNAKDQK